MKNSIIITSLLLLFFPPTHAQKQLITDTTYRLWTSVDNGRLSNDGNFALYKLNNAPLGGNTYIVTGTLHHWDYRFTNYSSPQFSSDSKYVFAMSKDTLVQLTLNTNEVVKIPGCKDYHLMSKGNSEWLIYQLNDDKRTLLIKNLKNGKISTFSEVNNVIFNDSGLALLFITQNKDSDDENLHWVDVDSVKERSIYQGKDSSEHIFDPSGKNLAFTTIIKGHKSIWYFQHDSIKAILLANDESNGISNDKKINTSDVWRFSNDGKKIFFTLSKKIKADNGPEKKSPDIWSYQDAFLLSAVKKSGINSLHSGENLTVILINQRKIRQLLSGNLKVPVGWNLSVNNNKLLVESSYGGLYESEWNKSARTSYYVCNVETGSLIPIKENCTKALPQIKLSPSNKYIVYFDSETLCYISFNTLNRETHRLTNPLNYQKYIRNFTGNGKIEGWIAGTEKLIVRENYDLWLLDAMNDKQPYNLTKGIGIKDTVAFAMGESSTFGTFSTKNDVLIGGFNLMTKENGVYLLNLKNFEFKPVFVTKEHFIDPYDLIPSPTRFFKAKTANRFLIKLETANKSANYQFTTNFKNFSIISHDYPEQNYNWITSELVKYKDNSGNIFEGILYKPSNFDSVKRYPVVFNYYLQQSDQVNHYLSPEPSHSGINIPVLVSNDYIVFIPDIYQILRKPGESALNSVMAAVDYLSKYKWVDTTALAVSGHSLGGFETNYIVSHSNKFAAAFSAAGVSNLISNYNQTWPNDGNTMQAYMKYFRGYGMGEGLDKIPAAYIENSPILSAKNIQNPLLILHNNEDNAVPVDHSLQLFIQLRSLQKPVWLLQYTDEKHVLVDENNQLDCQKKVKEFFDVYLKRRQVPEWMVNHL